MQVSEKERQVEMESKFRDIATIVAEKCINTETKRPFSVSMIEAAMKEAHFSVKPSKSAKQQALELIRVLRDDLRLPIQRAQMRLRIAVPTSSGKSVKKALEAMVGGVDSEEWNLNYEVVQHNVVGVCAC